MVALPKLIRPARQAFEATLTLFFPPCCAFCDAPLDVAAVAPRLCRTCADEIFTPSKPACVRCGLFADREFGEQGCRVCHTSRLYFDRVIALGEYRDSIRDAVVRMKAQSGQPLASALGRHLANLLDHYGYKDETDIATCISKHWWKRLTSPVNSPEAMLSGLANQANLPATSNLLVCRRKIKKQAMLSPNQRRRNVENAWTLSPHYDIVGARVLLVDDTVTTGSTANAAAKALKKAGAANVVVVAVGRAGKIN